MSEGSSSNSSSGWDAGEGSQRPESPSLQHQEGKGGALRSLAIPGSPRHRRTPSPLMQASKSQHGVQHHGFQHTEPSPLDLSLSTSSGSLDNATTSGTSASSPRFRTQDLQQSDADMRAGGSPTHGNNGWHHLSRVPGDSAHTSGLRDLLHHSNHPYNHSRSGSGSSSGTPPYAGSPRHSPRATAAGAGAASPEPVSPTSLQHQQQQPLPPGVLPPPHALFRQASLATLAPPELSLANAAPEAEPPVDPLVGDIDAKWPDAATTQSIRQRRNSQTMSPPPQALLSQPPPPPPAEGSHRIMSPPLPPLFIPDAHHHHHHQHPPHFPTQQQHHTNNSHDWLSAPVQQHGSSPGSSASGRRSPLLWNSPRHQHHHHRKSLSFESAGGGRISPAASSTASDEGVRAPSPIPAGSPSSHPSVLLHHDHFSPASSSNGSPDSMQGEPGSPSARRLVPQQSGHHRSRSWSQPGYGGSSPSSSFLSSSSAAAAHPAPQGIAVPRRKRSSRSSMSSQNSSSSNSSRTGLDEPGSSPTGAEPASPPAAPRTRQPHLAMPERSGWEYGDDDEEDDDDADESDQSADDDEEEVEDEARYSSDNMSESSDHESATLRMSLEDADDHHKPSSSSPPPHDAEHSQPHLPTTTTSSSTASSAPALSPAAEAGDIDFLPEQLQYTDIDKPPPPPSFDDALPPPPPPAPISAPGVTPTAHDPTNSDDDEESLSVLERIFILSKSEYREHRLSVTRALPEWLGEVDICEAAEYVLPLLNGLASDDDEVKVGLAQGLDRLMFYFYSSCPLADIDQKSAGLNSSRNRSQQGLTGSHEHHHHRYSDSEDMNDLVQPMEMDEDDLVDGPEEHVEQQQHHHQPRHPSSGHPRLYQNQNQNQRPSAPMATDDEEEEIEPPLISVGAFTPILGLLLMETNIEVSSWARAAVVRFLCRINNKEVPAAFQDEHSQQAQVKSQQQQETGKKDEQNAHESSRGHRHQPYSLSDQARQALEQQILVDVVLGLARLESNEDDSDDDDNMSRRGSLKDDEDDDDDDVDFHTPRPTTPASQSPRPTWTHPADELSDQMDEYATSPAKHVPEDEEGWAKLDRDEAAAHHAHISSSPDWGMPLRSFQPASTSLGSSSSASMSASGHHHFGFSAFDGDTEIDDEATQGKIASLELVSAIALSQCLPQKQLADAFLPEVQKMVDDGAPRVRSIAASALGPLAKALPVELVINLLVPLLDAFSSDPLPLVRRWACLTLPDIFSRLPPQMRHDKVVQATAHFSSDKSRDVRSALTEICGPLIHSFAEREEGEAPVPDEILDWYLGKPAGMEPADLLPSVPAPPPPQPAFAPLPTALSSLTDHSAPNSFSQPSFTQLGHPTDPERAMICAYNLPAVALTLGASRWHILRDFYLALTKAKQVGIRRSLAASLHAIVGIIGPEQSAQDLVSVAHTFLLEDEAREVREMMLEHFVELVLGLPLQAGEECLNAAHRAMSSETPQNLIAWRAREEAAGQMAALAAHFAEQQFHHDLPDSFYELLHDLLKDEVAAVRTAAVKALPAVFESVLRPQAGETDGSSRLISFLRDCFATNASYRHRSTFVACASAVMLETDVSACLKELFQTHFLPLLDELAQDSVINVRMAVAKLVHALASNDRLWKPPAPRPQGLDTLYRRLHEDPDRTVREMLGTSLDEDLNSTGPQTPTDPTSTQSGQSAEKSSEPYQSSAAAMSEQTSNHAAGNRSTSRESTPGDDNEDFGLSSSTLTDLTALGSNDIDDVFEGAQDPALINGHHSPPATQVDFSSAQRSSSFDHAFSFAATSTSRPRRPSFSRKFSHPTATSFKQSAAKTPPLRSGYSDSHVLQSWSPEEDFVRVES